MPRLTLLLPATQRFAGVALPAPLARALGRADRVVGTPGERAQLARHFRLLPDCWPEAALARVADAGLADAQPHAWLRADPAHIRPDINGARLLGMGSALGIDQGDVDALLPALRPLFGDAGFALDAPSPQRWYLRLPRGTPLPAFASPEQALGDDVFEHMPDGPQGRRWRVLLSEAQVLLHNHPHNAARLAAGKVPVNSLWCWGGGVLPDRVEGDAPIVASGDALLRGLAAMANIEVMPTQTPTTPMQDGLVDLRDARDPRALLASWMPGALAAAAGGAVLDFADGVVFTVAPGQRWRWWRKPLPNLHP